jgi:hypothetical protein
VWFRYTAAYTGHLRVNTIGSDYDTVLSTYSSFNTREPACNDDIDDSTYASEIEFKVTSGATYYIEVTSRNDSGGGLLVLNAMSEDVPPDNDTSDNAIAIRTLPYTIQEDTMAAAESDDDPWHTCTGDWNLRTVWFYYRSAFTGTVRINTFGSDYDPVLSVYDGDSGDELECNDDATDGIYQSAVDLPVTAGKSYWIEVSEYNDEYATGGTLFLNLVNASARARSAGFISEVNGAADQTKISHAAARLVRRCCTIGGNAAPRVETRKLHRREAPPNPFAAPGSEP